MTEKLDKPAAAAGLAIYSGMITGVFTMVVAVFSFFNYNWVGAGVSLVAAALAFGLVANAILRN